MAKAGEEEADISKVRMRRKMGRKRRMRRRRMFMVRMTIYSSDIKQVKRKPIYQG